MEFNKKRAQGLPLNTIVIALLVVVVLVVIVLAFTTNIAGFNDSVNEQSAGRCDLNNQGLSTLYDMSEFSRAEYVENSAACEGEIVGTIRNASGSPCCLVN